MYETMSLELHVSNFGKRIDVLNCANIFFRNSKNRLIYSKDFFRKKVWEIRNFKILKKKLCWIVLDISYHFQYLLQFSKKRYRRKYCNLQIFEFRKLVLFRNSKISWDSRKNVVFRKNLREFLLPNFEKNTALLNCTQYLLKCYLSLTISERAKVCQNCNFRISANKICSISPTVFEIC